MSRTVIDRICDLSSYFSHFQIFIENFNLDNDAHLQVDEAGISLCHRYLSEQMVSRYGGFSRQDLRLIYRSVVGDIGFVMYAAMDEVFPPSVRGNYTDNRHVAMIGYICSLLREASGDDVAPIISLSRATKVKMGTRFKVDPREVFDFIQNIDLGLDEYRGLDA
jgi:hypothetical protein